jgi:hypothetical protein
MRQQQKRSSTQSKAPQPSDLLDGEIALNTNGQSPAIYIKDADGVVRQLGGVGQVGETSVNGRIGTVTLDKTDVGLANVDNTSDLAKPISTDTQTALDAKADLVNGKVPSSQIPSIAITQYLGAVASQAAMLALSGQAGDWCNRTDTSTTFVLIQTGGSSLSDWQELTYPSSAVVSVNSQSGAVVLGAGDVGALASGDNISELTNNSNYITSAGAPVQSVNTKTGAVVLSTNDVSEGSTNKYVTASQKTAIGTAVQPGDDVSDLNNDAGYLTTATVPAAPVQSVNSQVGVVSLGLNNLSDVSAGSKSVGDVLSWDGSAWVSASSLDGGAY